MYPYMKFPCINIRNAKIWGLFRQISLRTLSHVSIVDFFPERFHFFAVKFKFYRMKYAILR